MKRTWPSSSRDLRFCESSISASLEVWRKYLYTIFLAAGCQANARVAKSGSYEAFPMLRIGKRRIKRKRRRIGLACAALFCMTAQSLHNMSKFFPFFVVADAIGKNALNTRKNISKWPNRFVRGELPNIFSEKLRLGIGNNPVCQNTRADT